MLFRKIATILLLTFLFFNWVGYWLFLSWCESRETIRWETRLDHNEYNAGALIHFKIPATAIPYSNSSTEFERADGDLQIGDIHYRYVRKRLYNDSVEFLCLPDKEAGALSKAKNDMLRLTTGLPATHNKSSSAKASHILVKVFWQETPAFSICNFLAATMLPDAPQKTAIRSGHTRIGKHPPRILPRALSA